MAARLPAEISKLARAAIRLKKSGIPMARILSILAQRDGDISTVVNRVSRVEDAELRSGFAAVAKLLEALEKQTGAKTEEQSELALPGAKEVFPTEEPTVAPGVAIDRVKMFIDGASKGNPGPAGIGMVFTDMSGHVLWQACRKLDENATNNVAEYEALREGLLRALGQGWKKIHVFSDSELLVRQMLGQYKIKNETLRRIAPRVRGLINQFEAFTIASIPREQNRLADRLATHAIKNAED